MNELRQAPPSFTAHWPWIFAALVGVIGVIISLLLWYAQTVTDLSALRDEFHLEAQNLRNIAEQEVQTFTDVLDSIQRLHSISDQINSRDFEEFVEKGMLYQQRILGAFGFVQRIDREGRRLLEQSAAANAPLPIRLTEFDNQGQAVPARDRPEYFALTYQTPTNGLGVPTGFDFGSSSSSAAAIRYMIASGDITLGGEVPAGRIRGRAFFVFAPILYSFYEGRIVPPPGYLIGFSVAVFQPDRLMERLSQSPAARDLRLGLFEPTPGYIAGAGMLTYENTLPVANRTWIFRCEPSAEYLRAHRTRQPELLLFVGLAITVLVTLELLLLAGRARRIERIVQSRTADLTAAKSMLEAEMAERMRLESEILEIGSREKLRVGQDLHDSLGQKLTGAMFLSRTMATKLAEAGHEDRESAERINELLKDSLAQVRRLARGLAPVELGDEGLANALQRLATDARETYGIDCEFHAEGDSRIRDTKTALHLYHIAQEAVNNAARHGQPRGIRITLAAEDGGGRLTVEDDGKGLPEKPTSGGGMGLRIMQYRASMIGGLLDVQRRKEGGTIVTCRFA